MYLCFSYARWTNFMVPLFPFWSLKVQMLNSHCVGENFGKFFKIAFELCVCVYVCVCVCVCVCVRSHIAYTMGTKCPHQDSNTSNLWPCEDIFGSHEETNWLIKLNLFFLK